MYLRELKTSLRFMAVISVLTGLAYPFLITGLAQAFFHRQANGSVIVERGQVVGSRLIGQTFDSPKYFWSRPSATTPMPYNASNSSGSNLGPSNPVLLKTVQDRIAALKKVDPGNRAPIPVDLVTASGSGLDPHITLAAADYQVGRVARERRLSREVVAALVRRHTQRPLFGLIGQPTVNVLELNLDLDRQQGTSD